MKYMLKTSRDPKLLNRLSELYDSMKLKMATKLVALHNRIERYRFCYSEIIYCKNLEKNPAPGEKS